MHHFLPSPQFVRPLDYVATSLYQCGLSLLCLLPNTHPSVLMQAWHIGISNVLCCSYLVLKRP